MNNSSGRIVLPELLDTLPPQDRSALRSRRDLRRLNQWMKHPRLMARALRKNLKEVGTPRIVELGAGDGHFLLSVARRLRRQWPNAEATLVDQQDTVDRAVSDRFAHLGWRLDVKTATAADWLRRTPENAADVIVCNLFLHHFQGRELEEMLSLAARATKTFVALEPRRYWFAEVFGHLLWIIRCNAVTRHDAIVSIRAGFAGQELSALWPDKADWEITERPAGWFSHLFIARRKE
jgi:hypothetical protein